jgi:peroxiredoxin
MRELPLDLRKQVLGPVLVLAAAVALDLSAVACTQASHWHRATDLNRVAPELGAETLAGVPFELAAMRGKVVVLYLWAAWHCVDELAGLDEMAARLLPHNVAVISVSIDRDISVVKRVVNSRARWQLTMLHDPTGQVARRYDPSGFPAAYVIDGTGRIQSAFHDVGLRDLLPIEARATEIAASTPPGAR